MYLMLLAFRFTALYLSGLIIVGTIIGAFPVAEFFAIILPIIIWGLSILIERYFEFQHPKWLNTKTKRIITYLIFFCFGLLSCI